MVKFTGIFDNSFASPMPPLEFVKEYYLTEIGRRELVDSSIKQESAFAALKNEESAQHSLQQLKAEIAAKKKAESPYQSDYEQGCVCGYNDAIDDILRQLSAV